MYYAEHKAYRRIYSVQHIRVLLLLLLLSLTLKAGGVPIHLLNYRVNIPFIHYTPPNPRDP